VEEVRMRPTNLKATVRNLAPERGTYLTPVWVGFHSGSYDLFQMGAAASPGLESLAEDGATGLLASAFASANAGSVQGVLDAIGPIAPGASVARLFTLDSLAASTRFASFASMVIPSNDAFAGNDDPRALRVFDADEEGAVDLEQPQRPATDGEDLVRTERGIDRAGQVVHIDHVVEHLALGIPEARFEGFPAAFDRLGLLSLRTPDLVR
jgi:hypothetical protein